LQVLAQSEQLEYYTELMKKFGPKETTFAVLYSKEDYKHVKKFIKRYPESVFPIFKKKWDDHNTSTIVELDGKKVEIRGISKTDDVPTFPGISYCMRLILGLDTTRYNFMCVGSSGNYADPFKQTLYSEAASRLNITINGSINRLTVPDRMQYLCTFPASFQTITVRESAINTSATVGAGIQLNRNMFSSLPINHVSGVTSFIIGSQFEFTAR
jgi:hypothetical protein